MFLALTLISTSVLLKSASLKIDIMPGMKCKAVTSKDKNTEEAICASLYWTVPHTLGKCNVICFGCGALHWREKSTLDQRNSETIHFSACCQKGKVTIPSAADNAPAFPPMLEKLFVGQSKSENKPITHLSLVLTFIQER